MQNTALLTLSTVASGAVTRYRAVGFDGAQLTTEGALAMGIAQYDAGDGEALAVIAKGTAPAESGAAVSVGDELVADASGRVIVNPGVGGEVVIGHALEAASAAGEPIEILLP